MLKKDPAGNNKVDKEKSAQKVDGVVATIMALAKLEATAAVGSIYLTRGVRTLGEALAPVLEVQE